jgi:recombination protein RecT
MTASRPPAGKTDPTTEPTPYQPTPYQSVSQALQARRAHFKQLLGTDEAADRFVRVVLVALQNNPELLEVEQRSLLLACLKAAADGLMPDGREAVLLVYNERVRGQRGNDYYQRVAQYQPMTGGMLRKLWESGLFAMLDGAAVYERDVFRYQRGDDPRCEHIPYDGEEHPGQVRAAYFIAKLKTGEVKREVMWRRDIERVRAQSRAPDGLMWKSYYDQAAIKSVIRRAFKQLPSTPALEAMIEHDAEAFDLGALDLNAPATAAAPRGGVAGAVPIPGTAPAAGGGRLRARVRAPLSPPLPAPFEPPSAGGTPAGAGGPPTPAEAAPAEEPNWFPTPEEAAAIRQREIIEAGGAAE